MKNHKQILMKSEIFFKEPPMVCMNQECGGILTFLANSPLKFAWIIGIYGKPFLNFMDFQESPYRFPPPIGTLVASVGDVLQVVAPSIVPRDQA